MGIGVTVVTLVYTLGAGYEPLTQRWFRGCAVFDGDHFTLSAQYAALSGPRAMFLRCRLLKACLCPAVWFVRTPCCPNRIVFTVPPDFATTMCDLVGCDGVRFGLL